MDKYNNKYDKKIESELRLEKIYIKNAKISRSEMIDSNLDISLKHNIKDVGNDVYEISLIINITNKDNTIDITAEMIGRFASNDKSLIETNAIAIMFPYLRSYISTLTTQPDMIPIVLQPINVMSLIDKN